MTVVSLKPRIQPGERVTLRVLKDGGSVASTVLLQPDTAVDPFTMNTTMSISYYELVETGGLPTPLFRIDFENPGTGKVNLNDFDTQTTVSFISYVVS